MYTMTERKKMAETARDLLWCEALTQILDPQEVQKVISYFNERRADRPSSTEEGSVHKFGDDVAPYIEEIAHRIYLAVRAVGQRPDPSTDSEEGVRRSEASKRGFCVNELCALPKGHDGECIPGDHDAAPTKTEGNECKRCGKTSHHNVSTGVCDDCWDGATLDGRGHLYQALRETVVEDTDLDVHFETLEIIARGMANRLRTTRTEETGRERRERIGALVDHIYDDWLWRPGDDEDLGCEIRHACERAGLLPAPEEQWAESHRMVLALDEENGDG